MASRIIADDAEGTSQPEPQELGSASNPWAFNSSRSTLEPLGISVPAWGIVDVLQASCGCLLALTPLVAGCVYIYMWVYFLSNLAPSAPSCSQPLVVWLGVYLAYSIVMIACVSLQSRLQILGIICGLLWTTCVYEYWLASLACRHGDGGIGLVSRLGSVGHASHWAWRVRRRIFLRIARTRALRIIFFWCARRGHLRMTAASRFNIDEMELVPYCRDKFADPSDPDDLRPSSECCICYEIYDGIHEIRRTPCGHLMHRECLSFWLRTANTCPICRECLDPELR